MKLMGIKNCHSCAKRSDCNLKDSPENLSETPKVYDHMNRRILRHGIPSVKITSFCKDYEPEEKSFEGAMVSPSFDVKSAYPRIARNIKGQMLATPFNVVTKEFIRKQEQNKKTARKRWKK